MAGEVFATINGRHTGPLTDKEAASKASAMGGGKLKPLPVQVRRWHYISDGRVGQGLPISLDRFELGARVEGALEDENGLLYWRGRFMNRLLYAAAGQRYDERA